MTEQETTQQQPRHGDERNRRRVTHFGEPITFVNATTGETVYQGPASSLTQPEWEAYCATCQVWQTCRGLIAAVIGCPTCKRPWHQKEEG